MITSLDLPLDVTDPTSLVISDSTSLDVTKSTAVETTGSTSALGVLGFAGVQDAYKAVRTSIYDGAGSLGNSSAVMLISSSAGCAGVAAVGLAV